MLSSFCDSDNPTQSYNSKPTKKNPTLTCLEEQVLSLDLVEKFHRQNVDRHLPSVPDSFLGTDAYSSVWHQLLEYETYKMLTN